MNVLTFLIPIALFLGLIGLGAFFWALRNNQFDDPKGQANRILSDRYDDHPAPDEGAVVRGRAIRLTGRTGAPKQPTCPGALVDGRWRSQMGVVRGCSSVG
jgi:cbb3-type cytochrome oxidase maturation protein